MGAPILTEAIGRAWDTPTACYTVAEPESLIGLEITDLGGRLPDAHIAIFVTSGRDGRKSFLTAEQARCLASSINTMADRLDAGATTARDDA